MNKNKFIKYLIESVTLTLALSILTGCNSNTTTSVDTNTVAETYIKTSTYGSIAGKEIKFKDLEKSAERVSDLLAQIYYEDFITLKLAESKGIKINNKSTSDIEVELLSLYDKEISDEEAEKYVKENPQLYCNFNLLVAKFNSLEESNKYSSKDISTLAKTISTSELLKQSNGMTGLDDLRKYTNSLESHEIGYVTPTAIPFEDGYAFIKIVERVEKTSAIQDAKNDLANKVSKEDYLADREETEKQYPYER